MNSYAKEIIIPLRVLFLCSRCALRKDESWTGANRPNYIFFNEQGIQLFNLISIVYSIVGICSMLVGCFVIRAGPCGNFNMGFLCSSVCGIYGQAVAVCASLGRQGPVFELSCATVHDQCGKYRRHDDWSSKFKTIEHRSLFCLIMTKLVPSIIFMTAVL